jgi:hypothetical protein
MSWKEYHLPEEGAEVLAKSPSVTVVSTIGELVNLACGGLGSTHYEVTYDLPEHGQVVEAIVARVRNGVSVN